MTGVDPDVILSDHNYLLSLDIVFMKKTSISNNFLFMSVGFFSQFIQKIKGKNGITHSAALQAQHIFGRRKTDNLPWFNHISHFIN